MPNFKGSQFVGFDRDDWRSIEEASKKDLCNEFYKYFTQQAEHESKGTCTNKQRYLRSQDFVIDCMRSGILQEVAKYTLEQVIKEEA